MSEVTKRMDDYILDKDCTIWVCELSNGENIYQDDERPGLEIESAWIRLAEYLTLNKLDIVSMKLKFRSHEEHVGKDVDGFFFRKSVLGGLGLNRRECPVNQHFFLAGVLKDGLIQVTKWHTPELTVAENEVRDPLDRKNVGESLIVNNKNREVNL